MIIPGVLLVVVGTRLANGRRSGRGVYRMSRFSVRGIIVRGIISKIIYILAGVVTVVVFRYVPEVV
mgnify:CR=1 FL=1